VKEPKQIDPKDIHAMAAADQFWAVRGKAIEAYAHVEHGLLNLFSSFAGIKPDVASVVFFRITNPRVLGEILNTLLEKKYPKGYSTFWNSLDKTIRDLSETRNRVVHWVVSIYADKNGYKGIGLVPQDFFNKRPGAKSTVKTDDLVDFIAKCDFVWNLCNMFTMFLDPEVTPHWTPEEQQTWRDIFQQPVVYPPPSTHPLFPTPKESEIQPQPSQVSISIPS
jgi:hypothetical protein